MKLLKRFLKILLILLIILSIAAIIYVLQWKEKPAELKPPKKEAKQAEKIKTELPEKEKKKKPKEKEVAAIPEILPEKEKEKRESEKLERKKEKEKAVETRITKIPSQRRQVAIIIDDIGNDLKAVRELLKIDADITFAVMPFCSHTREAAETVHRARREILLHLPMEPASYPRENPGKGALFTDMNEEELLFQLNKNLASVPHISGVNNHMGSKFMGDEKKLKLVFDRLKTKNMFFIDSRTTPNSKASAAAKKADLPIASRRIFLDNNRNYNEIYKILTGVARDTEAGNITPTIIIGHPYPETIRAIRDANKILREKGVVIVPVSKLVKG
ncbi:MAG TPA: divergent polysaccharide deacetylase family protein [Smithellaceae bacterium]|nr:divergent polysaccharide deacetylase family protein [Smithellaceae bacterium]